MRVHLPSNKSPNCAIKWRKYAMAAWVAGGIAAASLVGGLIGGSKQNKANQSASREQMAFQERMSSSAYQRAMTDMRKAGLNPILAYKQGGASTPTGQTWQAQNVMAKGIDTASSAYATATTAANTRQQTALTMQNERMAKLDADKKEWGGDNAVIGGVIDANRAANAIMARPRTKKGAYRPPVKKSKLRPLGKKHRFSKDRTDYTNWEEMRNDWRREKKHRARR